MKIPQDIIDQVLSQNDIVDIVSARVPLKRTGANYKGLCPFHQEKSPSFTVSADKQIFHCFGCGAGGNAIGFVMRSGGLTFPEAVRELAARVNIKVPDGRGEDAPEDPREMYYKVNAYAGWFFGQQLAQTELPRAYLQKRGLSDAIRERFELGYAPEGFESLLRFLDGKKVPLTKAAELGLVKKGQREGYYDFFRGRLMFPIHNSRGRVIGFGGRILVGDSEAKYINSPESPVYSKSYELYGLYQAKRDILTKREAVVVEGYIDVLACVQLGISNVVAPLGTALTPAQVQLLQRSADTLILMFDGDAAGRKAALKGFDTCLSAGTHPRVVILPDNRDPGDYLVAGDASLAERIEQAAPAMDWVIADGLREASNDVTNRMKILRELLSWVRRLPDPLERAGYRNRLAQFFEVPPGEIDKIIDNASEFARPERPVGALSLETLLVCLYLRAPGKFPAPGLAVLAPDFDDSELGKLAAEITVFLQNQETFGGPFSISQLLAGLPGDMQGLLSRILLQEEMLTTEFDVAECIKTFQRQKNKRRLKEITARILEAETANDVTAKRALLQEKQRVMSQL
jgi:DNA primase